MWNLCQALNTSFCMTEFMHSKKSKAYGDVCTFMSMKSTTPFSGMLMSPIFLCDYGSRGIYFNFMSRRSYRLHTTVIEVLQSGCRLYRYLVHEKRNIADIFGTANDDFCGGVEC